MDELQLDADGHPLGLTGEESRLTSDYLQVLDLVSRAAQALERGQWTFLKEKAEDLSQAAADLAGSAAKAAEDVTTPRTGSVLAAVTARGWEHRVVRGLHPGPYAQPRDDDPAR
ncbi:hypothetical protein [Streptomyces sp. XH2]|uniref:hypothetical protein n=1 Tax=Streptomyces sp. XH2 TaxID=3412483 RepID=UPI003C7B247E